MSILSNFTETTNSDNRHLFIQEDTEDDIIIGGTCKHIFRLPFKYSDYATSLSVFYKQGLTVILERTDNDSTVIRDETTEEGATIVTVQLNPSDTELFSDTLLDTFVQLRVTNKDNEVIYDNPCKIIVRAPLEYSEQ